eukprot:scaffold651442_cov29-Prasinocladus_malaysianus.AAC.1
MLDLEESLAAAVRAERYSEAANIKSELTELQRTADSALAAQQELEAAIAEERYEDAAAVRDTTAV